MGGLVLGILAWQEGGEAVGLLLAIGAISLAALAYWLVRRKREGKATLIDPDLFTSKLFRLGISGQMLQNIALGGAMITIPIYLQMVLEYNALQAGSVPRAAVAEHVRDGDRRGSTLRQPASELASSGPDSALLLIGMVAVDPDRPARRCGLVPGDPAGDRRDRPRTAGLPAQQLHPGADRRGAGQRSRRASTRPPARSGCRSASRSPGPSCWPPLR